MFILNLAIKDFLDNFWQKKPTVIKQGMINFQDPIQPDEIAGLAMEEEIESRLVYRDKNQKWQAQQGPFTDFSRLDEDGATLLIQSVDHWHKASQEIVRQFRFLPNWRFDDLMISYSTPEGGVGPHIDNYDVFIIQGLGKRHWRVGDRDDKKEFAAHGALKHCEPFDAIIDVTLMPSDILYIPCGFPHEGYAIEPSISYSVGFRAPDRNDLLRSYTDYVIDNNKKPVRYRDGAMKLREKPGKIENNELKRLHQLMLEGFSPAEKLVPWLGELLSESNHELDILEPDPAHSRLEIMSDLNKGNQFIRLGGLRAVYFECAPECIYINGDEYSCKGFIELGDYLCNQDEVGSELIELFEDNEEALNLFVDLINSGYWYVV
ncbi:MAG: cupin domain-containing protein [Psychromonas sp.]|nr:cupin domain-containing protein [Psychromonas sp.]